MRKALVLLAAAALAAVPLQAVAQGSQNQISGMKLSRDEPIQIQGNRLEVRDGGKVNVLTGDVTVVQGPTLLKSAKMIVYLAEGANGAPSGENIERLEVEGGVYLKSEDQVATGDHGTFDMRTEVMVLSGKEVVLSQGENVIVGCKLTVQMRSGQATLESCASGPVKMLLTPSSARSQQSQ